MKIIVGALAAIILVFAAIQMMPGDIGTDQSNKDDATDEDGSSTEVAESENESGMMENEGTGDFEAPSLSIEPVANSTSQVMAVGATRPYSTVRIYKDAACTNSNGAGKADDNGNFRIPIALAADAKWQYWVKAKLGDDESPCSSEPVEYTQPS